MYRLIVIPILFLSGFSISAQELNCDVVVNPEKVQVADPAIFQELENAIYEFMNNRKWTDDIYQPHEKIECKLIINITDELSSDRFEATAIIQSSRPVFNSDYKTILFNYSDSEWEFKYSQYQPIEFNENAHLSNLSSMLAYYANIIIGLDYDSFSPEGGTPYFLKAQTIVSNAQNTSEPGWKAFESLRNRYWLVDNILNKKFKPFRALFYNYHRQGLDLMYDKKAQATKTIVDHILLLDNLDRENPNSMIVQLFFTAKSDELMDALQEAPPPAKAKVLPILSRLDATNAEEYEDILR